MTQTLEIAAGLDLHKKFIIATILILAGGKMQERFERTHEGLLKLKNWILSNKVQAVGCENCQITPGSGFFIMIAASRIIRSISSIVTIDGIFTETGFGCGLFL